MTQTPHAPSTAPPPGPRLPDIPGPLETAGRVWRKLRKMSTALGLLFALTAASIVATFVPQRPLIPTTVNQWIAGEAGPGAGAARVMESAGLFDVFGSWWFGLLVALLFTSLTGCLLPRWRGWLRVARRQPPPGRNLERLGHCVVLETSASPDEALTAARGTLKTWRRRELPSGETASGRPQVAAERGHGREGGSLIFHTAFYLILLGAVIGKLLGFEGHVNVAEGEAFAETRIAYALAEPGRWFGLEDHRGFTVRLDDFEASFYDNGVPSDFVSRVSVSEGGEVVRRGETRVNHPLAHDGMKLYQTRWGMAPHIVLRAGDSVLFEGPVLMSDAGGSVWTGVAKVSMGAGDAPQIALDLVLLPDAAVSDEGVPFSRSPEGRNPRLIAELYVGEDLGLDRPVPASRFDRDAGQVVGAPAILAEGGSSEMAAGNLTLEFAELSHWSGFQVSHSPGRGLLLAGAILLLAGLIPSLYSYRRRLWVEAEASGDRTRVVVAGVALQRKPAFDEDFDRITSRIRRALPDAREATGP